MINMKNQQGTVLIVALFIVALLEIVVVGFVMHHKMSIYHSRNYVDLIEAQSILLGAEEQAKKVIIRSYLSQKTLSTYNIPKISQKGGYVQGIIADAQGKFNLNNMFQDSNDETSNKNIANFSNLVHTLFRDQYQDEVAGLIEFLRQRSQINAAKGGGAYFASITELRAAPGVSQAFYVALAPYIVALPSITSLNINSATDYSLLTIDPKLTLKETKSIIRIRDSFDGGFSSTDTFYEAGPIQALAGNISPVTIVSEYFIATFTVQYQDVELTMNSLLKIYTEDGKPRFKVIWRSFGTL
jgi:general secretion pathway protein K